MSITLFSIPKPFHGHIGVIQANAIESWTRLGANCEIILFGDEEGTAEMAARLGVKHVPEVARNEYGTPLLSSVFEKALQFSGSDSLGYVNADIILMSDFSRAMERVKRWSFLFFWRPSLTVGRRWDVEVEGTWDFGVADWETRLRNRVQRFGTRRSDFAIDYFVFNRSLWGDVPPFAIGRTAWDNWLIYRARYLGAAVINATSAVLAVHQNHDYSHAGGKTSVFEGPEARRNQELAGGNNHYYSLADATWTLTPRCLRPAWGEMSRQRKRETEAALSLERAEAR